MRQQLVSLGLEERQVMEAGEQVVGSVMGHSGADHRARREPCSTRNNGKLQLAAIVHYDSLQRLTGELDSVIKHDNAQKGATLTATYLKQTRQQVAVAGVGENSHDNESTKEPIGRFSRLFFTKKNAKKKKCAHRQEDGSDLIDNSPAKPLEQEQKQKLEHIQQLQHRTNCSRRGSVVDLDGTNGLATKPSDPKQRQVIEFKFDLIVEGDRVASPVDLELELEQRNEQAATCDDDILRPIRQRKLLDNVNELVESFVLDSMDVCLLTTGQRRLLKPTSGAINADPTSCACDPDQFDYLLKCAQLSITYAFQLLEATKSVATAGSGCSPLRSDGHSIELEAILFEQPSDGSPMDIVDLLLPSANWTELASQTKPDHSGQVSSRECLITSEALEAIETIRSRLSSRYDQSTRPKSSDAVGCQQTAPNVILMVRLKLKQQVNGGSFTNRMCLLDVAEPKSNDLTTIIESIFSGQALGYLKKQKLYLRTLETMQISTVASSNSTNNKHLHQIASLTKLIRAEWLIYKQLSSALIKTLAIVHCHRLATSTTSDDIECSQMSDISHHEQVSLAERHLMDYNLGLLEFVQALQRASTTRLKRRKRHLQRHLAKSNLSLVSDTNLSMSSSTDHWQPPALQQRCSRAYQDLMISSPFRHRVSNQHRSQDGFATTYDDHQWTEAANERLLPFHSSYSTRHHRHHRRANQRAHTQRHHHHQHFRDRQTTRHCNQTRPSRATSLNRHNSATNELDVTESSSPISTPSSGGHRNNYPLMSALDQPYLLAGGNRNVRLPSVNGQFRIDTLQSATSCLAGGSSQPGSHRLLGLESDADESVASLASTSMMSCHSSRHHATLNPITDPRTRRRLQQVQLDSPSDSNTIDDSIEMQSFSSSVVPHHLTQQQQHPRLRPPDLDYWQQDENEPQADNASDTCSVVVAEPPRQLKLEEFLNRLSNFIGPQQDVAVTSQLGLPNCQRSSLTKQAPNFKDQTNNKEDGEMEDEEEEEEEDCKSHSSILDHLSSLTLESNLKMVKQQQQQQLQLKQQFSLDRVSIVAQNGQYDERWPSGANSGHLQRLLKSTLRLQQRQQRGQTDLTDQLRALTIDCDNSKDRSVDGLCDHRMTELCGTASSGTPPTSIESSCASSSASSSSTSSCSRNATNNQRVADQMYSSVVRPQNTTQIKLP